MIPEDWRTPRILYAVEVERAPGDWVQLADHRTPFPDVAARKAGAAPDTRRVVPYLRNGEAAVAGLAGALLEVLEAERKRDVIPVGWVRRARAAIRKAVR